MIAWFMRRRCFWCARSAIGMCWPHHVQVNRRLDVAGRWALVVLSLVAFVALWAIAGRRWLP